MNLKPIEPGCLAVIINNPAGGDWVKVSVLRMIGEMTLMAAGENIDLPHSLSPFWEVDKDIPTMLRDHVDSEDRIIGCPYVPERRLLRINDRELGLFDRIKTMTPERAMAIVEARRRRAINEKLSKSFRWLK